MAATAPTQFGPRDFAKLDDPQKMMIQDVYESLPKHPAAAAPLSRAAAAWGPSDGADRLSILPAVLLRNVVSRLPAKDAARTTVLSKRWRRVWHSVPLSLVDALRRPRRSGVQRARRAPRALPHRQPRRRPHGRAPGRRGHALAPPPRRQGSEGTRPHQPCRGDRPRNASPPHSAQLQGSGAPLHRFLGLPQPGHPAAESRVPPAPGTRLLFSSDGGARSLLPPGEIRSSLVAEVELGYAPRLESLLLWGAWGPSGGSCWIKVGHAPNLRFLGYLVPGVHHLIVGGTVIKAETKASPSTTVPSVCVLAVQVKLGTHSEVSFLPSILRCFPNTETLYVQCAGDRSREPSLKLFWEDIGPIECINQHLKKLVLCQMQGTGSELQFLKFVANNAHLLEKVVILMGHECAPDDDLVQAKLRYFLTLLKWGSKHCTVSVFRSKGASQGGGIPRCFQRAFNLPNVDPFDDLPRDA
ncbi:unnamed protein product [Urochloa decumbens]|uniref:F-box domain-containing protein n=1 Tax=Urochloa decumbens TaxID=240449 RepID=A0ABC9BDU3_9POAL